MKQTNENLTTMTTAEQRLLPTGLPGLSGRRINRAVLAFITFSLLLTMPAGLLAGWVRQKGEWVTAADISYLSGDGYYSPDGTRLKIPVFTEMSAALSADYGLTERVSVSAYLPVRHLSIEGTAFSKAEDNTAPGDLSTGVRWQFARPAGMLLSGGLTIDSPTGDSQNNAGLLTGDGEFNFIYRLALAGSIQALPSYWRITAGFNQRTAGFSHEVRFSLLYGLVLIRKRLSLELEMQQLTSLENSTQTVNASSALFTNNTSFTAWRAAFAVRTGESNGLNLYYKSAFAARNIIASGVIGAGFWQRF